MLMRGENVNKLIGDDQTLDRRLLVSSADLDTGIRMFGSQFLNSSARNRHTMKDTYH